MCIKRYFLRLVWTYFTVWLIWGCVGKKPDDDVALIKQLLSKLERGINQKNTAVLDSIMQDKKKNIASQLLDSLWVEGKLKTAQIVSKSFLIVKDSAEVRLRLALRLSPELIGEGQKIKEIEKPIKLLLHKKRGKWKIKSFSMREDE